MPTYRLEIVVEGRDQGASSVLDRTRSGLGGLAQIAVGTALGQGLVRIAQGIASIGRDAVGSAAEMQNLSIALETLVAKELARGEEATRSRQKVVNLTEEEKAKLADLRLEYNLLGARLQEQRERVRQMTEEWTDQGLATQTAKARLAEMEHEFGKLGQSISDLQSQEGKLVTVQETYRTNTMELSEAMKQAGPKADELKRRLRDLSLISPFEYTTITDVLRTNLAFGATTDNVVGLTKAMTDVGAGLGLTNEQFDRMTYNLGQALLAGDLTAANLRQLRMVGLDLAEVFESELGLSVEEIGKKLKAGKMTMKDVSQAFADYAEKNFGGASERLSKTFSGLKSSFRDLFFFAGADTLTPLLEVVTEKLGGLFDRARGLLESGALQRIGEQIGEFAEGLFSFVERLGQAFQGDVLFNVSGIVADLAESLFDLDRATATGIGQRFLEIARGIQDVIGAVSAFVGEHAEAFKAAILAIGAVLVGSGLATAIAAGLGAIGAALGALLSPIVLIAAAVGLLAAAWTENWFGIRDVVGEAVAAIAGVFAELQEAVGPALERLRWFVGEIVDAFKAGGIQNAVERFKRLWPDIQSAVRDGLAGAASVLGPILESIGQQLWAAADAWGYSILTALGDALGIDLVAVLGQISSALSNAFDRAAEIVQEVWPVIQAVVESAIAVIWPAIQRFVEGFKAGFSSFGPVLEKFQELWKALQPVIEVVAIAIGGIILSLVTLVVGLFSGLAEAIQPAIEMVAGILEGFLTAITGVVNTIVAAVELIWAALQGDDEAVGTAWEKLKTSVMQIVTGLVDGIVALFGGLWETVKGFVSGFVDGVIQFAETLYDELIGHSIIPDMIDAIVAYFKGLPERAKDVMLKGLSKLKEAGKAIVEGLKTGIENAWEGFKNWIKGKLEDLVKGVLEALGVGSPAKRFIPIGESMPQGLQVGWAPAFRRFKAQVLADVAGLTGGGFGLGLASMTPVGAGAPAGFRQPTLAPAAQPILGGDQITIYVQDQLAGGLLMNYLDERRRGRLNVRMGG